MKAIRRIFPIRSKISKSLASLITSLTKTSWDVFYWNLINKVQVLGTISRKPANQMPGSFPGDWKATLVRKGRDPQVPRRKLVDGEFIFPEVVKREKEIKSYLDSFEERKRKIIGKNDLLNPEKYQDIPESYYSRSEFKARKHKAQALKELYAERELWEKENLVPERFIFKSVRVMRHGKLIESELNLTEDQLRNRIALQSDIVQKEIVHNVDGVHVIIHIL